MSSRSVEVRESTGNLAVVAGACHTLLTEHNDFWVLAALTEASFEEGVRNRRFRGYVESYQAAGVSDQLLEHMRGGTNGNLKRILEAENAGIGKVTRTVGKGQDLSFGAWRGGAAARIEVKLVYDCTYKKYYHSVAADWEKLAAVRSDGFEGDLFLVVFFTQLPRYEYPSGISSASGKESLGRSRYLVYCGIASQFRELARCLTHRPAWPESAPLVHPLSPPAAPLLRLLNQWLRASWKPDRPWKFNPDVHLAEAAAGVAIWQIP